MTIIAAALIFGVASLYSDSVKDYLNASKELQERNRMSIDNLVREFQDFKAQSEFAGRSITKDVDKLRKELDVIKSSLAEQK